MAGELIAFDQLGHGIAAFGIGPMRDLIGPPFSMISAAVVALPLAVFADLIIRQPLGARQYLPLKPDGAHLRTFGHFPSYTLDKAISLSTR
jgi:hypothetical protein